MPLKKIQNVLLLFLPVLQTPAVDGFWRGPNAAFSPQVPPKNTPVLQSSCKVALAGDPPVPTARTVCPCLAWGHTEVPVALGSVPCLSLGRRGGRSAGGMKVLRHKALKNLNISLIMGRHLHFTAFEWARSL